MCVDGAAFARSLHRDVRAATESVFVQTLSLEGDGAGKGLASALLASKAPDRRIIADSITEYMINDRFRYTPANLLDRALRAEIRATGEMVETLRDGGVAVKHIDPIGLALHKIPVRNHKKLVVIDGRIVYVGGINFTEHNYAWHDFMVRFENEEAGGFLREDFLSTWGGRNSLARESFGDVDLHCADGNGNHHLRGYVRDLIAGATSQIFLECPYITDPLFAWLGEARRRGVEVTIMISDVHNRLLMKEAILEACRRQGLEVLIYQGRMTHAKAMLIDQSTLLLGSANFDFNSFHLQPEIMGVFRDPSLIAEFQARVIDVDLANSRGPLPRELSPLRRRLGYGLLRTAQGILSSIHARADAKESSEVADRRTRYTA